jgi:hypothetical protein
MTLFRNAEGRLSLYVALTNTWVQFFEVDESRPAGGGGRGGEKREAVPPVDGDVGF